jgi:hypothetical protein
MRASGFARNLHCPGLEGEDLAVGVFELDTAPCSPSTRHGAPTARNSALHGTKGRFTYRDNKLALCPAWDRTTDASLSILEAWSRSSGASGAKKQQMEVKPPAFADIHNPLESAFAIPRSRARRAPRAGADFERRPRSACGVGALRIDAHRPRRGVCMKLGIVSDEIARDFATAIRVGVPLGLLRYEVRNLAQAAPPSAATAAMLEVERLAREAGVEITALSPGLFKNTNDAAAFRREMDEVYPRAAEWAHRWKLQTDRLWVPQTGRNGSHGAGSFRAPIRRLK